MNNHIIVGMGQIGTALFKVLRPTYSAYGYDRKYADEEQKAVFDVLHIAFPCKEQQEFITEVKRYKKMLGKGPALTIIHSTVPVGTIEQIDNAVHSPVRGIHPNLEEGIRTFTKFFGGPRAEEAANIFRALGITCATTHDPRNTEALKLWDTTQYGVNIALEKIIWKYCQENNLDFEIVYTAANQTYNEGYEKLGHPEYKKYILKHISGPIGGHCVMQNLPLLNVPEVVDFILKKD